jgi:hypothetical protein
MRVYFMRQWMIAEYVLFESSTASKMERGFYFPKAPMRKDG